MQSVELMDRSDTKFILSWNEISAILPVMTGHYRVLEVNGIRGNNYETLYYDTPDFHFYTRHQNGKMNRLKIRKRRYVESNLNFLEVKFKTNRDQTIKDRRKLQSLSSVLEKSDEEFIAKEASTDLGLEPKIWNSFRRITLVSLALRERITIDLGIAFKSVEGKEVALNRIIIVEVKQPRRNRMSPFVAELHRRHIRPQGISKYCLGVALLCEGIKKNAFKERIRKIKSIENDNQLH
jgi:hypothetical protein